MIVISTE